MALPALASFDDLETISGLSLDEDRAEAILSAASTLVRSYTGRTWVGADGEWEESATELQQDIISTVVLAVAERVYRNPAGTTQQATGPFSQSVAAWASYGMVLTDDEKDQLPNPVGSGVRGLSSIRVQAPARAAGAPRATFYSDLEDEEEEDE